MTDAAKTKEDLEKEKLQQEIKGLKRAEYTKLTFWLAVLGVLVAISGTIGQSFVSRVQAERAQLLVDGAELKQQKAEAIRTKAEGDTVAAQQKQNVAEEGRRQAEDERHKALTEINMLNTSKVDAQTALNVIKVEYDTTETAKKGLDAAIVALQDQVEKLKTALNTKKALPLEDRITFVGRKEPASPEELKASANPDPNVTRRYYMGVKIPTDTSERVTKVTYFMNNPLFPQPVLEGKGDTFEQYYIGRSCLSTIIVTLVIEDAKGKSRSAQRVLNLCSIPEVGDDRK